jgi:hypothetical protein
MDRFTFTAVFIKRTDYKISYPHLPQKWESWIQQQMHEEEMGWFKASSTSVVTKATLRRRAHVKTKFLQSHRNKTVQAGAWGKNAGHKTVLGIHTFWDNMKWSKKNWQKWMAFDFNVLWRQEPTIWSMNFSKIIYTNAVSHSQEEDYLSITKTNHLTIFREITVAYC